MFNLNFKLRQRSTDQTYFQRVFPSIYNSKASRLIIDLVNTRSDLFSSFSPRQKKTFVFSLFRGIINVLIIGNAVCLGVNYNDLEWFFLAAFSIEALLKVYAMGAKEYFHHRWNIFDFTIIFVSMTYSLLSTFVPHRKTTTTDEHRNGSIDSTLRLVSLNRDVLDAILVVRILRLVKLVGNIERFERTNNVEKIRIFGF